MSSKNDKRIEGRNLFTQYPSLKFYIEYFGHRAMINTLEVSWGGYAFFDEGTLRNDIANYNVFIRRFFYNHAKDGYYSDRFIYINDLPESIYIKNQGLWFPRVFLHLQETYHKNFVCDYLKTLFPQIADYHTNHKTIKFTHYNKRGTENNTSISRPA